MMRFKKLVWFAASLAGVFLVASTAAAAPLIRTQSPCTTGNTNCGGYSINPAWTFPATLRSFAFNAPSAGRAQVTFHGSMICSSNDTTNSAVVDLTTQIMPNETVAPTWNGPGGLRHAIRILPFAAGVSDSFNLASTRVFTIRAAGSFTYYFRIAKSRLDPAAYCYVYNLTFSVVFI